MFFTFIHPLFNYISFKAICAFLTALLLSLLTGEIIIKLLRKNQKQGQPIRSDGPQEHIISKTGTPTMGGILIIISLLVSVLIWADIKNPQLLLALIGTLCFGVIGGVDDFLKLSQKSHKGLPGKFKLLGQVIIAISICLLAESFGLNTKIYFPFFKNAALDLDVFFPIFGAFVIVGASNAVNLTDGLDGLAIVPVIITSTCFAIICYLVGHKVFSDYLLIPYVKFSSELCVFLSALIGSGIGFLWFNAPPAKVFMGDTGSLALGGALGIVGVLSKHEIVLGIIGGVFVVEALSVMLQVFYFKRTGKRIFLMAPIHHHFEKKGWKESTIVIRFWIISFICGIIGLLTLKIR